MCNIPDSQSVSWTLEQMVVLNLGLVSVDGVDCQLKVRVLIYS